jgi:hypothetical protein
MPNLKSTAQQWVAGETPSALEVAALQWIKEEEQEVGVAVASTPISRLLENLSYTDSGQGSPFPAGDGDIIRYNVATGNWESCVEPFEFQGIVLVPMTLPGSPVEGFIGYNIADNGLYVAVE